MTDRDCIFRHPVQSDGMTIHTVTGHMHQLGQALSVRLIRQDGTEECLLDIPRWDFDWQQRYEFEKAISIAPGDQLEVKCVFDNSQANQPVIDGKQVTSRHVQWGEGSLDEMCIAYFYSTPKA